MTTMTEVYTRKMVKNASYHIKQREILNTLSRTYNRDINKFKYNSNNTDMHEMAKFLKFMELRKQQHPVIVEGIFNNQMRADIIDLEEGVVFEIIHSEKQESIDIKKELYPLPIEIIDASKLVRSKFIDKQELINAYKDKINKYYDIQDTNIKVLQPRESIAFNYKLIQKIELLEELIEELK